MSTSIAVLAGAGREGARGDITIDRVPIPKVEKFRYLGSIVQQSGEIDENINQRIKVS